MQRNYVCGIIRDQLKRFLVVQYDLANGKRVSSISIENWISPHESMIKALNTEFKQCFDISSIDTFDIKNTKVITKISDVGIQLINVFLMDIKKSTTFKLLSDVVEINFMHYDQLLNAVNNKTITLTVYSKCIINDLHIWKNIT